MNRTSRRFGFALPVVLISSVVMMTLLLVSLSSVSSIASSIQGQHYQKLADTAAEAGANFAKACLLGNGFTATWSQGGASGPLKPNTDCSGVEQLSCPTTTRNERCGVIDSATLRTTFEVAASTGSGSQRTITVTGKVQQLRKTDSLLSNETQTQRRQTLVQEIDPQGTRSIQRYWIFGTSARLDFGTSGSTVIADSMPCSGTCTAGEGSTVVSRRDGTLQFWTDGRTIWNRSGDVMTNSSGLNANQSTTQAAAIFPLGTDERRYVVVTNNTENGPNNFGELYYSIVDMSLSGGLGAIPTGSGNKNVPLMAGTDYASEALAAAPKSDGSGYWVLTFIPGSTNVRVFSFNNSGTVTGAPQTYNVDSPATIQKADANSGFGSLNFNDSYTQLVMLAGNHCRSGSTCTHASGLVRVMSFNPTTGVVANMYDWNNYGYGSFASQGYSADFSPSANYVYTSTLYPARVARYAISGSTNNAAIKAGEQYVGNAAVSTNNPPGYGGGQVLAAPDGRMYVADYGANHLSVINYPDSTSLGLIGWDYGGQPLAAGKQSRYGLPQLVTVYTPRIITY